MKFQMLVAEIARLHEAAERDAGQALHWILSVRNWLIGAYIVAFEQDGEDRAEYGARLLERLARALGGESRGGLSARNLRNFRQVALVYAELDTTEFRQLGVGDSTRSDIWQTSAESPAFQIWQTSAKSRTLAIWQTSAKCQNA